MYKRQVEAPVVQTQDELVKEAQSKPVTTLALSEANFDFGKLKKGDHVEHIYEVTNTGTNPLIISQVKPCLLYTSEHAINRNVVNNYFWSLK